MTALDSEVTIRDELEPGDLGYVMYLHGLYYRPRFGYGTGFEGYVALAIHDFYRGYDPARDRVWICEHGERIVGSLVLMHQGEDVAQLRLFLLLPDYQGLGLGREMMRRFLACARQRGYRSIFLWTTEEQAAAVALYRKLGFVLTEEKYSTVFGKPLREQRFELTLA